ncbi:aminotransferase-like domain-containing protein [Cupriavidus necator]
MLDPRSSLAGNLGGGEMPATWLNDSLLATALRSVARSKVTWAASYGDTQGYLPLRKQLQVKLRELGIDVEPRQILTTIGAADALSLIVTSYLRAPGAKVMVDAPCSFLLLDRLLASGLDVVPIPRQVDGPDIDALRAACERHRPSMFFCQSLLHNPTSTSLSPQKAYQVLRLADEFDFTLVEDDSYGDLAPTGSNAQLARLAPVDQLRRVIYVGGFSRTLGPGMRVGFIAAHPDKIAWLLLYKSVTRASNCSLSERTIYRVLAEGGYRHHCEQLRMQLDRSRLELSERLHDLDIAVPFRPEAGMYLWGRLPHDINAFAVAEMMLDSGYLTAPGQLFSTTTDARPYMRFSVPASSDIEAFRELSATLRKLTKP